MKAILPDSKERLKLEAIKEVEALFKKKCLDYDTSVLFTIRISSKHGKKRLRRFFDDYVRVVTSMKERYGDCAFDKMREELNKAGVDVLAWEEEV